MREIVTGPKMGFYRISIITVLSVLCHTIRSDAQPNIILIVADDMGWNDVGFHGSNQIPTPNIDALAYNGILLNSHYVQPSSTATRAALFTGKYPMRFGMQGPPIEGPDRKALPEAKLLPQYLKELGYTTHLIGKWHLGHSKWNQTPTDRGFDSFLGFYNDYTGYYDYIHTWKDPETGKEHHGFDLHNGREPAYDEVGRYATDLFTDEALRLIEERSPGRPLFLCLSHLAVHSATEGQQLQAPRKYVDQFGYIVDPNRKIYAGMVAALDESVGKIVSTLSSKGILEDTIIVFISSSGAASVGPTRNWGSNAPLRGQKGTLWEGGVRTLGLLYSPRLVQPGRVSDELVHVTDWLPTLYTAAGGDGSTLDADMDGADQWSSLQYGLPSSRNDVLLDIDDKTRSAGLRFYNWKLVVGTTYNGTYDGYLGPSGEGDENWNPVEYNTSAIWDSQAGKAIQKASYTPVTELEYGPLRRMATLRCLPPRAQRNPCDPASGAVCLYDVPSDPCEENDLAKFFPSVVRRMKRALVDYRQGLVPQLPVDAHIDEADPKLFNHTWTPWQT